MRPPSWKGRRRQRIRSFRRPGGSGVQLASSDVVRVTGLELPKGTWRAYGWASPFLCAVAAVTLRVSRLFTTCCPHQKRESPKGLPLLVRVTGLEPARLAAREPKSRMSANSIIPAYLIIKKTYCISNRFFVERLTRLELATSTLARWRSTG